MLVAVSAFFFIAKPLSPSTTAASSQSSEEDDEDSDEVEGVDEEQLDDLELDLDDLRNLAEYGRASGVELRVSGGSFSSDDFGSGVFEDWVGDMDDCFATYLIPMILTPDELSSSDVDFVGIIQSVPLTSDFSDSYLTAYGRVLDSAADARELLESFDNVADNCEDTPFTVLRNDGKLSVLDLRYSEASYSAPDTVTAMTLIFSLDPQGIVGFRTNILQRGNAVIATVAIIKPGTTFDEYASDRLAESLAEGLGEF